MTYKEVNTMISSIGIPYAYNQFSEDDGQVPPFICFLYDSASNDLMADNINYQPIRPLTIELYTDNKDFALEETVESVLKAHELPFTRQETYLDSEQMFMIIYDCQIILTEEENNNG